MARACDRCSRLKTQCNGDRPCNRCERLALDCTQTRPVLAKGRPKRDPGDARPRRLTNNSQQTNSQSASPQTNAIDVLSYPPSTEQSLSLAHGLPELPLPEPIAAYLLDLVFSPVSNLGLLEVFSKHDSGSFKRDGSNPLPAKRPRLSPQDLTTSQALLYTLIVVGAALSSPHDSSVNISGLQRCAVNSIPALYSNTRELRIEDALSLCFLSYTGCLNASTVKVAERWAILASTIAREIQESDDFDPSTAFNERALWAVYINDRIFSLLHNRRPVEKHITLPAAYRVAETPKTETNTFDKMSIVGVLDSPTANPITYIDTDYFSLYVPLLSPLDVALSQPPSGSSQWNDAIHELDMFAEKIPPSLTSFNNIVILYQIEVSVWYHGIFILLYGGMDPYNYLSDKSFSVSHALLRCVEHAQLIGEAIPTLARLMRTSSELSPLTVYFVLLSAVIHGVALRSCMNPPTTASASHTHAANWAKLIESTHLHLFLLRRLRDTSNACTIDLMHVIEQMVQPIYVAATTNRNARVEVDISPLRLYRWTAQGRGIVKLSSRLADELCSLQLTTTCSSRSINGGSNEGVRQEILALFDVSTRKVSPGNFCKGITEKR